MRVINPDEAPEDLEPASFLLPPDENSPVSLHDGALKIDHGDGSLTIDFDPDLSDPEEEGSSDFYANLANKMDESELREIANDLLDGIKRDEDSRKEWMSTRARGITLLGLTLEDPSSSASESTAPLEGMSRVHHPLLLEATVRFQATARAELLPAAGPVKVRNDSTMGPTPAKPMAAPMASPPSPELNLGMVPPGMAPPGATPGIGHNNPPQDSDDDLAEAMEKDFNHFLTVTATEYVPDTDRMLFGIGFGGDGFKKVFNCPLRRRPVSESVDPEDLIVSNSATALANCGRVTHRIKMRKSVLRRMQLLKAYRDVDIQLPDNVQQTEVDVKKDQVQGQQTRMIRREDMDYTIYETYCELDLDEFAPKKLRGEGLPLPYRVTIERDSRQVLSVIRNWEEDDDQAMPKQYFVQFPFIRGLGFYGLGFIHLLGNTTVALTALWREIIDAGSFANFPGFIYLKSLGRQLTNIFRVPPGGGVPMDAPPGSRIQDAIMPIPYKEPGAAFTGFTQHMEEMAGRLAMTGNIDVGEGKQDAPVGTTLALIEQATKIIDSAHKRLHASQAEEFALLKQRFKEDPEAFWRHNKQPSKPWKKEQFLQALSKNDLVPVADPNNPTSLHRIAKANLLKQLQGSSPQLYNPMAVEQRVLRIAGVDAEGLFNETPAPDKPDPRLVAIESKAKASQAQVELGQMQEKMRMMVETLKMSDRAQDRQSRERIETMKQKLEETRLTIEQVKASDEWNQENAKRLQEMVNEQMSHARELEAEHLRSSHERFIEGQKHSQDLTHEGQKHQQKTAHESHLHEQKMEHDRQMREQKLEHDRQMHEAKLAQAKALARVHKPAKD